jgi:uncharacterized protein (DUF362 family)
MVDNQDKGISRRGFLGASIGAVAVTGLGAGCSGTEPNISGSTTGGAGGGGTGAGGSATGGKTGVATGGAGTGGKEAGGSSTGGAATGGSSGTAAGTALVAIVRGSTVAQATADAIAMAGGLPPVSGKSVLLKPNVNTGDPTPFSTNPEIVRAVIGLLKAGGASRIVIADRSYTPISTTTALAKSGITAVAQELGAETIDLDGTAATSVKPAGATNWAAGFRMYDLALTGVDVVINLCCCKNHNSSAHFTASLKNWVGLLHTGDRNTAHGDIGNRIPELHLAVRENLIVMDATGIVLTLGPNPSSGQALASPGIVVATKDNVACDVTALGILRYYLAKAGVANANLTNFNCWNQPQLVRALALGLGITGRSQYNYTSSGITEINDIMTYVNA